MKEEIHVSPQEAARMFRRTVEANQQRHFNLDFLTGLAMSRAQNFLGDSQESKRVKELATKVQEWVPEILSAIERGDARQAAVYGFKAGAAAAEMQLHHWRMDGITVTEFAKLIDAEPWRVSRMITNGDLQTNDKSRKRMRITWESAMPYLSELDILGSDPSPDEIEDRKRAERKKRGQFDNGLD